MAIPLPVRLSLWAISLSLCRYTQGMQFALKTVSTTVLIQTPENISHQGEAPTNASYKEAMPTNESGRAVPQEAEDEEKGDKYLIASFPTKKLVAYLHLPEKVWQPLSSVRLGQPAAIAIDKDEHWLYVSDIETHRIWRYSFKFGKNGRMETSPTRLLVVDGHIAKWMTVDNTGDLFFTGHEVGSSRAQDLLYKSEKKMIKLGFTLEPIRYSGFNEPNAPNGSTPLDATGITSDGNDIYWGRREHGFHHGSICKGVLAKNDVHLDDMEVTPLLNDTQDIKGLAITKEKIFFVADVGVYGISKGWTLQKPHLVANNSGGTSWSPKSIVWDTKATMYVTDNNEGSLYTFNSKYTRIQTLSKFADAPGIENIAFFKNSARCIAASMPIFHILLAVILAFSHR